MSTRSRRPHTSPTAALTALALSLSLLPAPAAAAPVGKGSVLTLEGDDPAKAVALTKALQVEFAARGVSGGRDMSLSELKLTMGCDEPPPPKCLADGGKTLGIDSMVYGTLTKSQAGYALNLSLLDVAGVTVQKSVSEQLPAAALEAGQVQATAKDLVNKVLGPEKVEPEPVKPEPEPVKIEPEPEPAKSRLVWGRQSDAPTWKKAGLGVSAALTVASFGAALGLFLVWHKGGPGYNKMIDFAKESYTDKTKGNEVPYWMGNDVCVNARAVENQKVSDQCSKNEGLAKANTAALVAGGVFLASTIAFTTLLFVHREKPGVARLQRRGVNFGAMPTRGGFVIGGGLKF